jgi:hypothetical protein
MHIEPYTLFVTGRIAELVELHDNVGRYQLLLWEDETRSAVRDIKEADVDIDWSTIPTNLRTAHRRVVNRMLNGADIEVRCVKDFFAGLTKAAALKTVNTVEGYEKALMASSRMGKFPMGDCVVGKFPMGDCVEEQVNVNYEDRYGRDLSPPVGQPSLAETLAAAPDDPTAKALYDYMTAPAEPGGAPFEAVVMLVLPNSPTVGQLREVHMELAKGEMDPETQRRFDALLERAEKREQSAPTVLAETDYTPDHGFNTAVREVFAVVEKYDDAPDLLSGPTKQHEAEKRLSEKIEDSMWLAAEEKGRKDAIRKAEIESGPYSIEAKLRFLNARLLDLPKGTPGRHKKIADIHHQIRRLSKKLPKDKVDPMVSSLSERLERILTPATA